MSRTWNHKALIDRLIIENWSSNNATERGRVIDWINEIQDDISSAIPVDYWKFKLKKLLPTGQEIISLSPDISAAPTTALAVGGSLTDTTEYIVYVTFKILNIDGTLTYIESVASLASTARTATGSSLQIDVSAIPIYPGDTSVSPATIHRNIYVSKKASGDTAHGAALYSTTIEDNISTTVSITTEPTSTISPPSDTEVDQVSSDHLTFSTGNRILYRENSNKLRRYDPNLSETTSPDAFDFEGLDKIFLYGKLSSSATTAQRTLEYYVYRRPHESFYDVTRLIDMPIHARKALIAGVTYKAWEFKDRNGWVSKQGQYEAYKKELLTKITRQRGAPGSVRDVNGDTYGYEVN